MYQQIQTDIAQEYYQKNYANDGQRFVAWYLRNIHNLDTIEAKMCITDGAGDKQIDAIYIDDQAMIAYIIQGKFYSGSVIDAEPLREVLASWVQIKDLKRLQEGANDRLKAKIGDLAAAIADDYEICFELITTSHLSPSAHSDFITVQNELMNYEALNVNLVLVDNELLQSKYDEALNKSRPYINHAFNIEPGKYMEATLNGTRVVIAALLLKECINIPGIKDGSLFRKNVRQSLGTSNRINKSIAKTLHSNPGEFFFLHNGITALCTSLSIDNGVLSVKDLNVVNGCQSLSTIYGCSESVRNLTDAYIMFRFYEITDQERADNISTSTNSQTAVKARDLRSNDKFVLAMKKAYEQRYTDGYFLTKRGEVADPVKYNKEHIVELTALGKQMMAWHSQRPTISYSESKIFDKYFDQLFHRQYAPENIQALNELYQAIAKVWTLENPLGINEGLLSMKSYVVYHHMYAVSVVFSDINKMHDLVPNPAVALTLLKTNGLLDQVISVTASCINTAFENSIEEATSSNKVFSPQNWTKAKGSLSAIRAAVKQYLSFAKTMPGGKEMVEKLNKGLQMPNDEFEARWSAD